MELRTNITEQKGGTMDAFTLLRTDHQRVAELFNQLESTRGQRKLTIFNQIKTELELHAYIEEKIFYPALEEPEETHELTLEAYEEHKQVKTLLRELGRSRTANEEWQAKAKVLQENVEHHVQEEENELFKKATAVLSREEIEELGERLQMEKERRQGRTSASKSSTKSSGAKKSASSKKSGSKKSASSKKSGSSKKTGGKKQPASKAAKKRGGSKKSSGSKSARAAK